MVPPLPGQPLPTEAAFGIRIEPRGQVMDWGRTCVALAYLKPAHRVFGGLLCRAWLEMRSRGCTVACGVFTRAVVRLYRRLGFEVEVLGPSRTYGGEERHPVRVGPPAGIPVWARAVLSPDDTKALYARGRPDQLVWHEDEAELDEVAALK